MVLAGGTVTIHNDQLKQVMLFAVGPDGDFSIDSWHHDPGSCRDFGLDPVFGNSPVDLSYRLAGVWVPHPWLLEVVGRVQVL